MKPAGAAAGLALAAAAAWAQPASPDEAARWQRGFTALRAMDCARCHGRDYRGWAAPSLVAAARDGSRERFDRIVLDGDLVRGMPGYRSQPAVAGELDAIWAYLRAAAEGRLAAGRPPP